MLQKIRLTEESPSFQLLATSYFKMLYPKRIESNHPLADESMARLKMVLMNDRYRFNQFSNYSKADNAFIIYDWLQPARSIEALEEEHFNRLELSVEGVEWKDGMEIICEREGE
jgi:hypothetical protein